ncbi:MAG TPA: hypothetical protein PKE26_09075 [Kiritimatiellia bacterium]|nr:hypothetical protein [Kiritimatiellia bacterium]HMO99247.1 hypothetical protein [Kiritimatiellia bacterium]HMP96961.1 hypothetical protein [Kiritimatiellia bacterium]
MLGEIKRRNRLIAKLNRRRAQLLAKVKQIEEEIKAGGGEVKSVAVAAGRKGSAGARRPRNRVSLADAIHEVLTKDKPLSATQIEQAVVAKGYKTSAGNFRTIIYQTLGRDKRFKKAERGRYVLK